MAQFKLLHYFDEEPIEPDFEMDFYVPIKINTIDIFRQLDVIFSSAPIEEKWLFTPSLSQ